MRSVTNNNSADFLLDGNEFFQQMHRSLRDLIANGNRGQNGSYVRLAYWMIANDLTLPAYGGQVAAPFTDVLRAVASAGHHVQIIAWVGNNLMGLDHNWLTNWVRTTNTNNNMAVGYTPMQLYLEQYGGAQQNCSTHQKIMVVSINGAKQALVGGFNISGAYLSLVNHNAANSWHDTGVRVQGPVVDDIEGEWVRRWRKQNGNGPAPNTAIGVAQGNAGNLSITTCTNNFEAAPAETDIRAEMITRIQNAQNLIYMENYALTDPLLVQELAGAVRGAHGHNPQVITIVDDPRGQVQDLGALGSYLMYYSFLELSLPNLASVDIVDGFVNRIRRRSRNVTAAAMVNPRVTKSLIAANRAATFNPATNYRFRFTEGGTQRSIDFSNIWGFTPNAHANVMYTLTSNATYIDNTKVKAYPHSKLAVFDSNWLVVGTSNWTYRSMQYDGEITLFINDATVGANFVTAARDRLFGHWNQPLLPGGWDAAARQNVVDMGNGTIPIGNQIPRVAPLSYGDFMHPSSREAWQSGHVWLGYGGSTYF